MSPKLRERIRTVWHRMTMSKLAFMLWCQLEDEDSWQKPLYNGHKSVEHKHTQLTLAIDRHDKTVSLVPPAPAVLTKREARLCWKQIDGWEQCRKAVLREQQMAHLATALAGLTKIDGTDIGA